MPLLISHNAEQEKDDSLADFPGTRELLHSGCMQGGWGCEVGARSVGLGVWGWEMAGRVGLVIGGLGGEG